MAKSKAALEQELAALKDTHAIVTKRYEEEVAFFKEQNKALIGLLQAGRLQVTAKQEAEDEPNTRIAGGAIEAQPSTAKKESANDDAWAKQMQYRRAAV